METYDIIILGAGIKGASEAYVLAKDARLKVTVIDPAPGTGTTGKSDGRLHSGGTGLTYDDPDILRRKLLGGTTLAALFPDMLQTAEPACYGFTCDNETIADRLVARAALTGIAIRKIAPPSEIQSWFADGVCRYYSMPEFAFNPAGTTAGFLRCAIANGMSLIRQAAQEAYRLPSGRWRVHLSDGGFVDGDLVISALGTAIRSLPVEGCLRLPDGVSIVSWPIATVSADAVPALDRILVTADPEVQMASIVKHGHVLAVDAKPAALREIAGPWELPQPNLRTYDPSAYVERYMIDALRRRYGLWPACPIRRLAWCIARTSGRPRNRVGRTGRPQILL